MPFVPPLIYPERKIWRLCGGYAAGFVVAEIKKIFTLVLMLHVLFSANAQENKKTISIKDSTDHAFDLSDYIIDAHGFVPIPFIITEPALGGFGLAVAPVFLKKRSPFIDSVNGQIKYSQVAPDITGAVAAYTANNTWVLAAFKSGMWKKFQLKYIVGGGYANVNMGFYRDLPVVGQKEFTFNFETVPIMLQGIKRIGTSNWYAGLKYMFLKAKIIYSGQLPSFVSTLEANSLVSQLGVVIEMDNRDNVFTPDKGIKFHVEGIRSAQWLGSDYDFWRLNYYMYGYVPIRKNLIGGLRIDGQQSFGSPPFYLLPYIDMRGVPVAKYQGNADILSELEARWDFVNRWSIVGFGGTGKAFDSWSDFGSAQWVVSYGMGFRYLIARKFKLRMGIDFAHSPGTFAYYIVFGSNWLK